jgi:hypothetical protein
MTSTCRSRFPAESRGTQHDERSSSVPSSRQDTWSNGPAYPDFQSLEVSAKTIEAHRKHIMDKLKLYNVAQLTKYAIREGITSADA